MLVTRKSLLTGIVRTIEIPVTEVQLDNWNKGMLIQEAMPDISADHREFIMTGVTPDEWDEAFEDDEKS